MRLPALVAICIGFLFTGQEIQAQATRPLPYSSQLRTDPSVGNVQGTQRYGRPLKTDPDQGEGFSYHVYPVADPSIVAARSGAPQLSADARNRITQLNRDIQAARPDLESENKRLRTSAQATILELQSEALDILQSQTAGSPMMVSGAGQSASSASPYPTPFDWTSGVRNFPLGGGPTTPFANLSPQTRGMLETQAFGFGRQVVGKDGKTSGPGLYEVFHQPLIQIKLRVVEVARVDGFAANSVLEYVSRTNTNRSLTSGAPLNEAGGLGYENARGLTDFAIDGLIDGTDGTGMLVNLTSEHINWVAGFLATEMNADMITAPEMVTLNGQNVEFVAGSKLPFALGQNVIQGTNNNIQQVFYKHVGTMVSVTPTIVNWGYHGEGRGEAAVTAAEITNWNDLIDWMVTELNVTEVDLPSNGTGNSQQLAPFRPQGVNRQVRAAVPFVVKSAVLEKLNEYTRSDLTGRGLILQGVCGQCGDCEWKPEDCTIDLTLVVRLSEGGSATELALGDEPTTGANAETNVRAVANVIQVKSGHGVVMAGLIGEREVDDSDKVPVLGDIPGIGFMFRSKQTARVKTEVLVFIEAEVLDPNPHVARAESAHDFTLGKAYVQGEFLDNPLEYGMYRVGFGTYLPPCTRGEGVFWERFGRKVRKAHTHVDDAFE